MKHEDFAPPEYKEGLEADAVCGQCGNVNPEGTLICKTCGNNLRDQRMLRMTADQMLEEEAESANRSVFLIRALSVLGILVVLWLGINAGRIASVLTSADDAGTAEEIIYTNPELFWTGPEGATYDAMRDELAAQFPSESDAESARMSVSPTQQITEGRYVVFQRLGTGMRFVGAAVVRADNEGWRYNAQLLDDIEIRGYASHDGQSLETQWDEAGVLYEGEYFAATGRAFPQAQGSISISGESNANNRRFSGLAYRYSGL